MSCIIGVVLHLRKEHRLRKFENRMLKRIVGSRKRGDHEVCIRSFINCTLRETLNIGKIKENGMG
jgi:hypothetical protein